MHKWAEEILKCVKAKAELIGIENFEGQTLDDLKDWTEIAKNIACFDKDYRIVEAMDKAEDEEEIMEMIERYEDYPERRYYDNYRYKTSGRFAPRGKGSYIPRRGYDEPYEMSVADYKKMTPEQMRDLDRHTNGVMYYTEPMYEESKYDKAKRMYNEARTMHKDNTPEAKQQKMKSLEMYTKELAEDITELITDMSAEEKNLLRSKVQTLAQRIQ